MPGKAWLRRVWARLWTNYWFLPAAMVAVAVGLSFLLPWIDHDVGAGAAVVPDWIYGGGPDGARALLTTIAGSMITVAALTFSITIVALSTASQQFGPRLLRNFIRDRGYQLVLGTFVATFVYCLLVLRTVRSNGSHQFVPYVSLALGLAFAVAGVGVLVYFIHHATSSIRAESIVGTTGRELRAEIERMFPPTCELGMERRTRGRALPEGFPSGAYEIAADSSGYVQSIDYDRLLDLAHENGLVLRFEHRVGRFLIQGSRLLDVWPGDVPSGDLSKELNECFTLGTQRSLHPDVESGIDQLVQIAMRSLSPGINDPDTAIACVDQLSDSLGVIGGRDIVPALRSYEGEVRLVTYPLTYAGLVDAAFSRIRQCAHGNLPVILRLLEAIASLAPSAAHDAYRSALLQQAEMLWRMSQESISEPNDLRSVELRYKAVKEALEVDAARA